MSQEILKPLRKVGRLNSLKSITRELRRVYHDFHHGRITASEAGTRTYMLTTQGKLIESWLLESRLTALEGRAGLVEHQVEDTRQLLSGGGSGQFN